jgi:hypothetical protein
METKARSRSAIPSAFDRRLNRRCETERRFGELLLTAGGWWPLGDGSLVDASRLTSAVRKVLSIGVSQTL